MARCAVFFTDKIERSAFDVVTAVTVDTCRAAFAEVSPMSAEHVMLHDTHVAATAECRYSSRYGNTAKTAGRCHCVCRIQGVAAMTGIAGYVMLRMDACLPEFDRLAELRRLPGVALDADNNRLYCRSSLNCGQNARKGKYQSGCQPPHE